MSDRSLKRGATGIACKRATHALLAGCVLLLTATCGKQPTSPDPSPPGTSATEANLTDLGSVSLCPRGSFEGAWIKAAGFEDRGRIEAAWLAASGDTLGMLNGEFGPDPVDGSLRFRATVSGVTLTVVLYELSGTFRFTDLRLCPLCGTGQGDLAGTWRDLTTGRGGRLKGEWGDIFLPFDARRMPLSGRWLAACKRDGAVEIRERPD